MLVYLKTSTTTTIKSASFLISNKDNKITNKNNFVFIVYHPPSSEMSGLSLCRRGWYNYQGALTAFIIIISAL